MESRDSPCLDPNLWCKGSLWQRIGSLLLRRVDIPSKPDYCWFDRSQPQVKQIHSSLVCQMLGRPNPDLQIALEWGNKGLQLHFVVGIRPWWYLNSSMELNNAWFKKELRCPWVWGQPKLLFSVLNRLWIICCLRQVFETVELVARALDWLYHAWLLWEDLACCRLLL